MSFYDKYGRTPMNLGDFGKDFVSGVQDIFTAGAKQKEAEEFARKQAEQQAAFKAAQERNRKAKEAANFQTVKETDLQVDNPVVKPAAATATPAPAPSKDQEWNDELERQWAEAVQQEDIAQARAAADFARDGIAEKKFENYMQKKQDEAAAERAKSAYQFAGKPLDLSKKKENPFLVANAEAKETPPVSEPVEADALIPDTETTAAAEATAEPALEAEVVAPKGRAMLNIPGTDTKAQGGGNFYSKYGGIVDEAYNQRMSDYELEKADAARKRAVIDRAYEQQKGGFDYVKGQFDAAAAKDNEEGGWGNPLGFLNGIGKAFYGRAVYNPKTGRYEQKTPKSWEELGTNLFRNLATIGSGLQFSAGRNGRGGTSFAMGYNPGMPAAIINSYRENQYRPFAKYEEIQHKLADEYTGKPWQFDVDLPRARHPFEDDMKKAIGEDILTQTAVRKLDQLAEFYGIEKGTDAYNMLADQMFDVKTAIAPKLRELARQIDESHLFDGSPELKSEVLKGAIYKLLDIDDPEAKQAERDISAQQAETAQLKFLLDQERAAREEQRKQEEFEEKKRVNDSTIAKNMWYANGKGAIKTNIIKYDENGQPVELEPYSLPEIEAKRNDLLATAEAMEAGTIPKTPEALKAWAEMYDEFFLRSKDVKDAVKYMGLTKEIDKTTGETTVPGLSDFRTQFDSEYKALMDQAEQLSETEKKREQKFGKDGTVNQLQTAVTARDQKDIPAEQKDKYRADIRQLRTNLKTADTDVLSKVHPNISLYDLSYAADYSPESAPFLEKADDIYRAARDSKSPRYQILNEIFDNVKSRVDLDIQEGIPVTEELIRRITAEELDKLDEYQRSTLGNTSLDDAMNKAIIRGYIHELVGPKF